jgi:hypothetical protein
MFRQKIARKDKQRARNTSTQKATTINDKAVSGREFDSCFRYVINSKPYELKKALRIPSTQQLMTAKLTAKPTILCGFQRTPANNQFTQQAH